MGVVAVHWECFLLERQARRKGVETSTVIDAMNAVRLPTADRRKESLMVRSGSVC